MHSPVTVTLPSFVFSCLRGFWILCAFLCVSAPLCRETQREWTRITDGAIIRVIIQRKRGGEMTRFRSLLIFGFMSLAASGFLAAQEKPVREVRSDNYPGSNQNLYIKESIHGGMSLYLWSC